jgi:hypothetical protein
VAAAVCQTSVAACPRQTVAAAHCNSEESEGSDMEHACSSGELEPENKRDMNRKLALQYIFILTVFLLCVWVCV